MPFGSYEFHVIWYYNKGGKYWKKPLQNTSIRIADD